MPTGDAINVSPKPIQRALGAKMVLARQRQRLGYDQDYHREYAERAYEMAQAGFNNKEIAAEFGITETTLFRWKQKNPQLREALRLGGELVDERIEGSVMVQATGYDYVEQEAIKLTTRHADGSSEESVEVVDVLRHQPADRTASIFWLKNRKRDTWNDGQQVDLNVKTDAPDATQLALALLATMQAAIAGNKTIDVTPNSGNDDGEAS